MNESVDIYCERLGPEFWAEPLNAISNIAFFIAAFAALYCARGKNDKGIFTLITLIFIIGTGSFLFHTLATRWASLADTLPILAYQVTFLYLYAANIIKLNRLHTILLLGAFFLTGYIFAQMPQDRFNGSLSYAPAILFTIGLGIYHFAARKKERFILLAAAAIFAISLTFRSLDMAVCEAFPPGIHYAWHMLNGIVLYLTARAYIQNR